MSTTKVDDPEPLTPSEVIRYLATHVPSYATTEAVTDAIHGMANSYNIPVEVRTLYQGAVIERFKQATPRTMPPPMSTKEVQAYIGNLPVDLTDNQRITIMWRLASSLKAPVEKRAALQYAAIRHVNDMKLKTPFSSIRAVQYMASLPPTTTSDAQYYAALEGFSKSYLIADHKKVTVYQDKLMHHIAAADSLVMFNAKRFSVTNPINRHYYHKTNTLIITSHDIVLSIDDPDGLLKIGDDDDDDDANYYKLFE
jgi:hypothetical protein